MSRPGLSTVRVFFRSRSDLAIKVLALRQQVAVLKRKRPRLRLNQLDRLFWTTPRAHPPMGDKNLKGGDPKIHRALKKLGFELSERTVARYRQGIRLEVAKTESAARSDVM